MTPHDRFLDTHWRALSQMLMDDVGLGLHQALDFVPAALEELDRAGAPGGGEPAACARSLAERVGCDLDRARRALGLVERALESAPGSPTPPSATRPSRTGRR